MTWDTLAEFIRNEFLDEAERYPAKYEEYLRALLGAINNYRGREVTCDMLISTLHESLRVAPLPFDEHWLAYTAPPDSRYAEQPPYQELISEFEFLQQIIFFQIADLRRLEDNGQLTREAWLGVTSPTGHSWYNFHVYNVFECAMAGIEANLESGRLLEVGFNWMTLAEILEMGRIYE